MIHLLMREFIDSFKSIRSVLIVLFITLISYLSGNLLQENTDLINMITEEGADENTIYTAALSFIVLMFGFLFTFSISHDLINREIELKTIRLLVTKTSRFKIIIGKFLGVMLFWFVTMSLSFLILILISGSLFLKDYIQVMTFMFYIVSLVLLVSTLIPRTKLTMFLGIFLGMTLPILGLVSTALNKWYLIPFKYLLPYNYFEDSIITMLIPLVISIAYILISIIIIKRKDL